jgi:drug/metabolite transporter (DMT)-like permease
MISTCERSKLRAEGGAAVVDRSAVRGTLMMLSSSIFFCIMAGMIKHMAEVDSFMVVQFRFVIGLALLCTAALFGRVKLSCVNGPLLFLRGLTGASAVFIFFLSISKLGVGKATVITYSFPAFASVIGVFVLKERLSLVKWLAVAAALVGVGLLAFKGGGEADGKAVAANSMAMLAAVGKYELLAIFGAMLSGVAVVLIKKLHNTDSTYAIFFAQCLIGLWLVIIPANVKGVSLGYAGGLMLLGIGVVAATGQLLMTEGYRHLTVTTGSLLGMSVPVLNFILGMVMFDEPITRRGVVGAVIVIVACTVVILADRKKTPQPPITADTASSETPD